MKYLFILACLLPFAASAQKSKYIGVYQYFGKGVSPDGFMYLCIDSFLIVYLNSSNTKDVLTLSSISGVWNLEGDKVSFTNQNGLFLRGNIDTRERHVLGGDIPAEAAMYFSKPTISIEEKEFQPLVLINP